MLYLALKGDPQPQPQNDFYSIVVIIRIMVNNNITTVQYSLLHVGTRRERETSGQRRFNDGPVRLTPRRHSYSDKNPSWLGDRYLIITAS